MKNKIVLIKTAAVIIAAQVAIESYSFDFIKSDYESELIIISVLIASILSSFITFKKFKIKNSIYQTLVVYLLTILFFSWISAMRLLIQKHDITGALSAFYIIPVFYSIGGIFFFWKKMIIILVVLSAFFYFAQKRVSKEGD